MTAYRVMVTGSRKYTAVTRITEELQRQLFISMGAEYDEGMIVVHGGAEGADSIAKRWALNMKAARFAIDEEEHLPNYDLYAPKRAPLVRNEEMAQSGVDVCLAFPLEGSGGTRHAMTKAFANKVPVINLGFQPYTQQSREFAEAYG